MNDEIKEFRQVIAEAEKAQRNYKEQRKTVNFKGERTVSPSEATYLAQQGAHSLRLMYAAYGLMRGKTFKEIENNSSPINKENFYASHGYFPEEKYIGQHPLFLSCTGISEYLEQYGFQMPYEEKESKCIWNDKTYKYKSYNPETCEKVVYIG